METALSCTDLTKRYGDVLALDRLTPQVPTGAIFGFLGPNGAERDSCGSVHGTGRTEEEMRAAAPAYGSRPSGLGFVRSACRRPL